MPAALHFAVDLDRIRKTYSQRWAPTIAAQYGAADLGLSYELQHCGSSVGAAPGEPSRWHLTAFRGVDPDQAEGQITDAGLTVASPAGIEPAFSP